MSSASDWPNWARYKRGLTSKNTRHRSGLAPGKPSPTIGAVVTSAPPSQGAGHNIITRPYQSPPPQGPVSSPAGLDKSHNARGQPNPTGKVATSSQTKSKGSAKSKKSGRSKSKKGQQALEMGIKNMEIVDDDTVIQTVEVLKRPGQTLGFYIREGNGMDRSDGVFISRIAAGSVVENNGLLRIGDEILTVNSVNVTHTSLDDVVILMSIPKRLVLTIRTRRSCSKNASCPSLCTLEVEEKPIVVLKKGRSSSVTAVETTEKCPDEFILASPDVRAYYAKHNPAYIQRLEEMRRAKSRPAPTPPFKGNSSGNPQYQTADDSGDSGLSSENSGYSRTGEGSSQGSNQPLQQCQGGNILERAVDDVDNIQMDSAHLAEVLKEAGRRSPRLSPRNDHHGANLMHSPRVSRRARQDDGPYLDYSSDTEHNRRFITPHHHRSASVSEPHSRYLRQYDINSIRAFQEEIERTHSRYEQSYLNSRAKYHKARSLSPECYNSDSEVIYSKIRDRTNGRDPRYVDPEDRSNSMSHVDNPENTEEIKHWLRKFDSLSYDLHDENAGSMTLPHSGYTVAMGREGHHGEVAKDASGYNTDEYWGWYASKVTPAVLPKPDMSRIHPNPNMRTHPRVTRKMSADSLLDYRTYQLEDPLEPTSENQISPPSAAQTLGRGGKISHSYSSLSNLNASNTPTKTRQQQQQQQSHDPDAKAVQQSSRIRDLQLSRKPLTIKIEEFRCYKPEHEHKKVPFPDRTLDGMLSVHILCGHGLKSSRTMLRDLYCVVEIDSVNKARTMIRTGAINFDWDESFDLDLENARELSFLVYSWDPNTRHRLCFSGHLILQAFIQYGSRQRIALKLEPKGVLYLDIHYKEPAVTLMRTPSIRKNALFGVDLEMVVKREKTGNSVPILVRRCVEEVERRGLDHVGIYRLCGSSRRKSQLREEFEKNVRNVDLSQDNISDINVITGVLKDFLRELPEPLFTNALYQMLLDALSVRLPGDPHGSATLMLSILECLPKANQETLMFLLDHLKRISLKSDINKMTSHNLAVCFGPVLLCPSPQSISDLEVTMDFKKHIEVLHYLLEIWPELRGGDDGAKLGFTVAEASTKRKKSAPAKLMSQAKIQTLPAQGENIKLNQYSHHSQLDPLRMHTDHIDSHHWSMQQQHQQQEATRDTDSMAYSARPVTQSSRQHSSTEMLTSDNYALGGASTGVNPHPSPVQTSTEVHIACDCKYCMLLRTLPRRKPRRKKYGRDPTWITSNSTSDVSQFRDDCDESQLRKYAPDYHKSANDLSFDVHCKPARQHSVLFCRSQTMHDFYSTGVSESIPVSTDSQSYCDIAECGGYYGEDDPHGEQYLDHYNTDEIETWAYDKCMKERPIDRFIDGNEDCYDDHHAPYLQYQREMERHENSDNEQYMARHGPRHRELNGKHSSESMHQDHLKAEYYSSGSSSKSSPNRRTSKSVNHSSAALSYGSPKSSHPVPKSKLSKSDLPDRKSRRKRRESLEVDNNHQKSCSNSVPHRQSQNHHDAHEQQYDDGAHQQLDSHESTDRSGRANLRCSKTRTHLKSHKRSKSDSSMTQTRGDYSTCKSKRIVKTSNPDGSHGDKAYGANDERQYNSSSEQNRRSTKHSASQDAHSKYQNRTQSSHQRTKFNKEPQTKYHYDNSQTSERYIQCQDDFPEGNVENLTHIESKFAQPELGTEHLIETKRHHRSNHSPSSLSPGKTRKRQSRERPKSSRQNSCERQLDSQTNIQMISSEKNHELEKTGDRHEKLDGADHIRHMKPNSRKNKIQRRYSSLSQYEPDKLVHRYSTSNIRSPKRSNSFKHYLDDLEKSDDLMEDDIRRGNSLPNSPCRRSRMSRDDESKVRNKRGTRLVRYDTLV